MKLLNVVGTRPNFMKIAPLQRELVERGHHCELVHTGQHYDETMSDTIFDDLELDEPDFSLEIGSGSNTRQMADTMKALEPIVKRSEPDWVVVVGDVNSTLAAALVADRTSPCLAHVEGGIRSGNREMPEENNRLLVDQLADAIFCFDEESVQNLQSEGISADRIFYSGDIMIDALSWILDKRPELQGEKHESRQYVLLTLHRPSNVDREENLRQAYQCLKNVQERLPVLFPVHPRTEQKLREFSLWRKWKKTFQLMEPQGYADFVELMAQATAVITDSGSVQQETTVLDIPCLTVRPETERAITVRRGTNKLVEWGHPVLESIDQIRNGHWKTAEEIELWDGNTAERIVNSLEQFNI